MALTEEERKRQSLRNIGDGPAAQVDPTVVQPVAPPPQPGAPAPVAPPVAPPPPARAPTSPSNVWPQSRYSPPAPAPGAEPTPNIAQRAGSVLAGAYPNTTAAVNGVVQDTSDAYRKSGILGATATALNTGFAPVLGAIDDTANSAARMLDPAANALKRGLTGDPTPASAGARPLSESFASLAPGADRLSQHYAPPAPGAAPGLAGTQARDPLGLDSPPTNQAPGGAAPAPTPVAPQNLNNIVRNGNSYSGMNIASDGMTINGQAPRGGYVEALGGGGLGGFAGGGGAPQPPVMQQFSPIVSHSGNDWAARNNLRNLAVSANSITNRGLDGRMARGTGQTEAYTKGVEADFAARNAQPGVDAKTNENNASMVNEANRAAASRYNSDQNLRGEMMRAGATRGATMQKAALDAQSRAMSAQLLQVAGGDVNKAIMLGAQSGMDTTSLRDLVKFQTDESKSQQELSSKANDRIRERFAVMGEDGKTENKAATDGMMNFLQREYGINDMNASDLARHAPAMEAASSLFSRVQSQTPVRGPFDGIGNFFSPDPKAAPLSGFPTDLKGAKIKTADRLDGMFKSNVSAGERFLESKDGRRVSLRGDGTPMTDAELRELDRLTRSGK